MPFEPTIFFNIPAMILAGGILAGLLLSIRLWTLPEGPVVANKILAITSFAMVIIVLGMMLMFSPYFEFNVNIMRILGGLTFAYSPLVYLYIQASIRKDFQLNWKLLRHFTLPIIFLLAVGSYAIIVKQDVKEMPFPYRQKPPLPARVVGLILLLYITGYLFFAAKSIVRHRKFVLDNSSFSDELHSKWLVFLFLIFLFPFLFVIFNFLVFSSTKALPFPAIGAALMLIMLHILLIFVPQIFAGFPEELQVDQEEDLYTPKYKSSSLEEPQKDRLHEQAMAFMINQQAFLQQDLTLQQLADSLSINSKYLSQVINEKSGKHFMDFVNEYRVNLAKEILLTPAYRHYTIVAIAQEVGFNSRSAFYASFKKFTGKTPSEYKAAQ